MVLKYWNMPDFPHLKNQQFIILSADYYMLAYATLRYSVLVVNATILVDTAPQHLLGEGLKVQQNPTKGTTLK